MKYDAVMRFWFPDHAELLTFLAKNKLPGVTPVRLTGKGTRNLSSSFNWSVAEGETPEALFSNIQEGLKGWEVGIQSAIMTGTDVVLDIAIELLPDDSFPVFSFTIPSKPLADVGSLGIDIKFSIWAVDDEEDDKKTINRQEWSLNLSRLSAGTNEIYSNKRGFMTFNK